MGLPCLESVAWDPKERSALCCPILIDQIHYCSNDSPYSEFLLARRNIAGS